MDLDQIVDLAESLGGANLRRLSLSDTQAKLSQLLASYSPLSIPRHAGQVWHRGRFCPPEGYPNLLDCIYPRDPEGEIRKS
jgi:hypothetical protein